MKISAMTDAMFRSYAESFFELPKARQHRAVRTVIREEIVSRSKARPYVRDLFFVISQKAFA
jgi:hypothetical protein